MAAPRQAGATTIFRLVLEAVIRDETMLGVGRRLTRKHVARFFRCSPNSASQVLRRGVKSPEAWINLMWRCQKPANREKLLTAYFQEQIREMHRASPAADARGREPKVGVSPWTDETLPTVTVEEWIGSPSSTKP